jgi:hypothetical protein
MANAVKQNNEEKLTTYLKTKDLITHLLSLKEAEMLDLTRFISSGKLQLNAAVKRQVKIMNNYTQAMLKEQKTALKLELPQAEESNHSMQKSHKIPMRLFRGPFNARGTVEKMPMEVQKAYKSLVLEYPSLRSCSNQLLYWTDGEKTLQEVIRLTQLETGVDSSIFAPKYFQVLHDMNLISWIE